VRTRNGQDADGAWGGCREGAHDVNREGQATEGVKVPLATCSCYGMRAGVAGDSGLDGDDGRGLGCWSDAGDRRSDDNDVEVGSGRGCHDKVLGRSRSSLY
jgi:hypothetical protein